MTATATFNSQSKTQSQVSVEQKINKKEVLSSNIESLKFMKVRIPENVRLIPKALIEAVKGQLFTVEEFYKYQEMNIKEGNPGNLLYALISDNNKIEGYLWAELNQLDRSLFINTFSISKDYWHKGGVMPKVIEFLGKLKDKHECPRVFWITTNDKFFVKHGFKRSKNVLMEYQD